MTEQSSLDFFCPLYRRHIPEGLCLDINFQRKGFFKHDVVKDVIHQQRITLELVHSICDTCIHMPLRKEDGEYTAMPTS